MRRAGSSERECPSETESQEGSGGKGEKRRKEKAGSEEENSEADEKQEEVDEEAEQIGKNDPVFARQSSTYSSRKGRSLMQ